MKKALGLLLCGGVLVAGMPTISASADDVTTGETALSAYLSRGDMVLGVDKEVNFGQQQLTEDANVDFGSKQIAYTVDDFTGKQIGFIISAQAGKKDEDRTLNLNGKNISNEAADVVVQEASQYGRNTGEITAELIFDNLTSINKDVTDTITFTITQGTTAQISE